MNKKEIKDLRQRLRLTQNNFARLLDVDPISVSRWERGEQRPKLPMVKKLRRLQTQYNKKLSR